MQEMIPVADAVALLRTLVPVRRRVDVGVADAVGQVLAEGVAAPEPLPPFTNSAMDGFAVRWVDVATAADGEAVSLRVAGESAAGHPYDGEVGEGEAVQISTGAVVPAGADTVVPVEETAGDGPTVEIRRVKRAGQHVRAAGEEVSAGDAVAQEGDEVTPALLGLLATLGVERVAVYARPRVAIVVTGAELTGVTRLAPGQIRDSNGPMLAAAVAASGGEVVSLTRVGDREEATREAIGEAAEVAEVVITSGGVSVGPHDLVRGAAEAVGFTPLLWRVLQKPGKPLFVARREDTVLVGLPGNPVSALSCFTHYLHPLLQAAGGRPFGWPRTTGRLAEPAAAKGDRTLLLRVRLDGDGVHPLTRQASHMLTTIAGADGYCVVQPGHPLAAGATVEVYLYPWRAPRIEGLGVRD